MKTMLHLFLLLLLGCEPGSNMESAAPEGPGPARPQSGSGKILDPDALRQMLLNRDLDQDGVVDYYDNCQLLPNPDQQNQDEDLAGDLCDACPNESGTVELGCPSPVRPGVRVGRDDWRGMFRDADWDQDGVPMPQDNCPLARNPRQEDSDADGWGDLCDLCSSEPSPDTTDGCPYGERWAVQVAIEEDPEAFCVETCQELETCHMITSRFPGAAGELVGSRCVDACSQDPSLRDKVIELGRSRRILTTSCELGQELENVFRVWDLFACDQLYCLDLRETCGGEYGPYFDRDDCIHICLDSGAYDQQRTSLTPPTGINCLIENAQSLPPRQRCILSPSEYPVCPTG